MRPMPCRAVRGRRRPFHWWPALDVCGSGMGSSQVTAEGSAAFLWERKDAREKVENGTQRGSDQCWALLSL